MTPRIATPHQAVRLAITVIKMRNLPSSTTQSLLTMTKAATDPSVGRKTFDSMVAEMDSLLIK